MRTTVGCLFVLVAGSGLAAAQPQPREKFLEPEAVAAQLSPLRADIQQCYLAEAADAKNAGHLDITLVIARDGYVLSASTSTPGLPAKSAKKIDSCIQPLVKNVMFPVRRNDTTAVVPFLFQRTESPGSGPQLSCWNPKGCR